MAAVKRHVIEQEREVLSRLSAAGVGDEVPFDAVLIAEPRGIWGLHRVKPHSYDPVGRKGTNNTSRELTLRFAVEDQASGVSQRIGDDREARVCLVVEARDN